MVCMLEHKSCVFTILRKRLYLALGLPGRGPSHKTGQTNVVMSEHRTVSWPASPPLRSTGLAGPGPVPNCLLKESGPGLICAYLAKMAQHIAPLFSVPAGEELPKAFSKSRTYINVHCHRARQHQRTRLLSKAFSRRDRDTASDNPTPRGEALHTRGWV